MDQVPPSCYCDLRGMTYIHFPDVQRPEPRFVLLAFERRIID